MRFRFLLFAILSANVLGGPQVPKDQKTGSQENNAHTDANKRVIPLTHIIVDPPFPAVASQQVSATNKNDAQDKSIPPFLGPEWIIVYITAVYVLITGLILCVMKRQADDARESVKSAQENTTAALSAARDSATAALMSVKAVMSAERAWITVLPHIWSPVLYPLWEVGDPIPDSGIMNPVFHVLPMQLKNTGRTPAKIDEVSIRYIHTSQHPTFLPREPEYGTPEKLHGHILIPQDEILIQAYLSPNGTLTKRDVADIKNSVSYLYAYGIVKYRDYCDGPHEIRFGFVYHFPIAGIVSVEKGTEEKATFRKDGPQAYNTHS